MIFNIAAVKGQRLPKNKCVEIIFLLTYIYIYQKKSELHTENPYIRFNAWDFF